MSKGMKRSYDTWRLLVQGLAFSLLIAIPVLNYRFHISFFQGWFQSLSIGKLWFVSPLEGLESILTSRTIYVPLLIGALPVVVVAFLLGRVFCGWICPINFLCDLSDRLVSLVPGRRLPKDRLILPRHLFWFALTGELILTMILGTPIFVFLSPPGLVGREIMTLVLFQTFVLEGVVILLVLGMNLVTRRMFCRYFCPLGALLALIGGKRRLQVAVERGVCTSCGKCKRICPLGLNPEQGEGGSLHCWNCGSCVSGCPTKALGFRWRS